MRYQLTLQWPDTAFATLEDLIGLENRLIAQLTDEGVVDGHDIGLGEANIFIHTDDPLRLFHALRPTLGSENRLQNVHVAFREISANEYTVLKLETH